MTKQLTIKERIGRNPYYLLSFKTGTQKTRKDRERNRKDKYGKRELQRQLDNEDA